MIFFFGKAERRYPRGEGGEQSRGLSAGGVWKWGCRGQKFEFGELDLTFLLLVTLWRQL